jgi:predicted Zn-dependent peptidase
MVKSPLPRKSRVKKYVGDNGVTILQQDNPTSRAFCIGVWITSGSRDERNGEEGLSHFLEHMLFKGTKSRSAFELSQAIEKVGGALEAFTTKEQVCVYAQVLDDHKELAADVLSDMVVNATFPADQLARERQVVLEEISDVMDAPDDFIHDVFASEVFPGHPVGKPILGTVESVSGFDRERLVRFARKTFRGPNVVIAVYGNIDKRRLMQMCDWAFRLPNGRRRAGGQRIRKYTPTRRLVRRKLHHQHICIGGRSCSYLDDMRYPLLVLTTLLGGTMSSRLFQRIREELGFTYSIFTYSDSLRDAGIMGTYMSVRPSNTGRVVREVFREFDKVRRGEITPEEIEDTKRHLKGRILLGLETSSARMMRIARNHIYYGRQVPERELIRRIDGVSRDDVLDIAREVLPADRNTIVSLGPSAAGLHL